MTFNHKNILQDIFNISWRLVILVLPWQIRILNPVMLAGWNWEQGSMSLYASWILVLVIVLVTVYSSVQLLCKQAPQARRVACIRRCLLKAVRWRFRDKKLLVLLLFFTSSIALLLSDASTLPLRVFAIGEWWLQVGILLGFAWCLIVQGVHREKIIFWFLISLIPHVCIGIFQSVYQFSPSIKWLGIASHANTVLGDSVIAHDGVRMLRAYGGFPHPNIFAGWLALAIPLAVYSASCSIKKMHVYLYMFLATVFSYVLILTYSRAAWVACIVTTLYIFFRTKKTKTFFAGCICMLLVCLILIYTHRANIFARIEISNRLEAKSVHTRIASLQTGWTQFVQKPFFGSGPNAILLDMSLKTRPDIKLPEPLEPPHSIFVLALDELGFFGFSLFLFLIYFVYKNSKWKFPFFVIVLLSLFDHYLWSFWSGQSLVMIAILISYLSYTQKQGEYSTV